MSHDSVDAQSERLAQQPWYLRRTLRYGAALIAALILVFGVGSPLFYATLSWIAGEFEVQSHSPMETYAIVRTSIVLVFLATFLSTSTVCYPRLKTHFRWGGLLVVVVSFAIGAGVARFALRFYLPPPEKLSWFSYARPTIAVSQFGPYVLAPFVAAVLGALTYYSLARHTIWARRMPDPAAAGRLGEPARTQSEQPKPAPQARV